VVTIILPRLDSRPGSLASRRRIFRTLLTGIGGIDTSSIAVVGYVALTRPLFVWRQIRGEEGTQASEFALGGIRPRRLLIRPN